LNLLFGDEELDFVFDTGCFRHVEIEDRTKFIKSVQRHLKNGGGYLLICFSCRNGLAWNLFAKKQIIDLFSDYFEIDGIRHISPIEGNGHKRYFHTVLMKKEK
jgi:ubiquinone/menaquinone biosynthesis C-methylase UbiE